MMDQILTEVFCPATSKSYDFWLPKKMTVADALKKICDDIKAFENNNNIFDLKNELLLCSYMTRKPLFKGDTLEAAGAKSGDKLAVL